MKKNIVVCCQAMDEARIAKDIQIIESDDPFTVVLLHRANQLSGQRSCISFCPWCGKELPFPCEEEEE